MPNKEQKTPLDAVKFWEEIEAAQLDPKNIMYALANFAIHHSKNDSAQVHDFKLFNSYKNY